MDTNLLWKKPDVNQLIEIFPHSSFKPLSKGGLFLYLVLITFSLFITIKAFTEYPIFQVIFSIIAFFGYIASFILYYTKITIDNISREVRFSRFSRMGFPGFFQEEKIPFIEVESFEAAKTDYTALQPGYDLLINTIKGKKILKRYSLDSKDLMRTTTGEIKRLVKGIKFIDLEPEAYDE